MENIRKITNDLFYIGASDRKIALFESVYPVLNRVSYNSYLLKDEKTVLFDTVDKSCQGQFFENIEAVLEDRTLDYMIINHLEPDHSAMIKRVIEKYPNVKIICNAKIKQMLYQFFEFANDIEANFEVIKEGDKISTGSHEFTFLMAPMVHWPEVMVTYDITTKTLFSADAFGSFGALNGNIFDDETELDPLTDEYRRYYTNIVGKYGPQVDMLLKKASTVEIETICPLHGLIIRKNIAKLIDLYLKWASYTPEIKSVLIPYTSVYGNTQNVAEIVANRLADKGVKSIKMYDVSMVHDSYILSDCFKYSHIVIATTTYNNNVFVNMENFIHDLVNHNLQNRTFAIIENGSWAPNCGTTVKTELEKLNNCKILDNKITIKSSVKKAQNPEIDTLVDEILKDLNV
ncbi:MAG: FprA family A-type flavoprotein [Candidatus Gastranaerophilales bacterium]|nr:FprA family A-type flavoprotein [Candidatus Gastranaerophilales bacterium]